MRVPPGDRWWLASKMRGVCLPDNGKFQLRCFNLAEVAGVVEPAGLQLSAA